jgi:hypothetical protein
VPRLRIICGEIPWCAQGDFDVCARHCSLHINYIVLCVITRESSRNAMCEELGKAVLISYVKRLSNTTICN